VSPSPDDLDRELAELLSMHHAAEEIDVRLHVKQCPHCAAIAVLIGNLRRDLWSLHERRAA
jgi:hypothetical protein